ncbi:MULTISPECIES: DUF456 domain-containing protein [Natronorubrum]|uniref:DUF456 domain-containing protein n=2 Tax=Natronorubrum bangense TaxID=61858 RepID=L9WWD1_9EURY|nr:DUF456 domain-containing protein [Natronorubrum bangense]ELY52648.1 hypothetical protein C494_00362 [Natronorubrum bangense JCM 10635]QCC55107.1 DUF456 domain-containing protein [Natronorubrum bangense]
MVDAIVVVAIALLVGGVVGTVIPLVPGGLFSLAGLGLYWWHSEFTEPGIIAVAVLALLGVLTLVVEFFGGSIAAKAGGASWGTTAAAAAVGIVLMLIAGPIGLLVGLFGTVFTLEFARNGEFEASTRSAFYATVGTLASTATQVLLTGTILVGFLVAVFLL